VQPPSGHDHLKQQPQPYPPALQRLDQIHPKSIRPATDFLLSKGISIITPLKMATDLWYDPFALAFYIPIVYGGTGSGLQS